MDYVLPPKLFTARVMEERREKKRLLTVAKKTSLQILPSTKYNRLHLTFNNLCLQTIKVILCFRFLPVCHLYASSSLAHCFFFLTVFSATYVMSRFHVFLLFADCIFFRHGRSIHFSPACCTICTFPCVWYLSLVWSEFCDCCVKTLPRLSLEITIGFLFWFLFNFFQRFKDDPSVELASNGQRSAHDQFKICGWCLEDRTN